MLKEEDHLITNTICMNYLCALTSLDMCISLHYTFLDLVHNTFMDLDLVHNTFVDLICITHQQMWRGTEEMGTRNVSNVRGGSVARRMTNIVGASSVHGLVWSSKL